MITIIIPVYNVEKYLEQAVHSVMQQTYPEWELLLINDGSTDNSLNLCRSFAEQDSRIKVIDQPNGGVSSARNTGLEAAFGQWICFLDGDDWLEKNCLEEALKAADNETDIVCWNFWKNGNGTEIKNKAIVPERMVIADPDELIKIAMFPQYAEKKESRCFSGIKGICTKLFRSSLIKENHLKLDTNLQIGEDAFFSAKCFAKSRRVIFLNRYLYHYRIDNLSATRKYRPDIQKVYIELLKAFENFKNNIKTEETDLCYGGLTYACIARALEKYYFHIENPFTLRKKMSDLAEYLNTPEIREGLAGIKSKDIFYWKQRMVIFCAEHGFTLGLYGLYSVKNRMKRKSGDKI